MSGTIIRFSRQGDRYVLSNGVIELRGELCEGRLVRDVRDMDEGVGWLDLSLKVSSDGKTWETGGVQSLADVKCAVTGTAATLDLWGEWWKRIDKWQTPDGISWRVHVQLSVGLRSGRITARIVDVVNSGTKPLLIASLIWNTPGGRMTVSGGVEKNLSVAERIQEPWGCWRIPDDTPVIVKI